MPKATPSKAVESQFGIQEGMVRVEDAAFAMYQMSPKKGTSDTYAPNPSLILSLKRLGDDGDTEGEADEQVFGCGKADKFAPTDDKNMDTPVEGYDERGMPPGKYAEGRYLMSLRDGNDFNKSSKYIQLNNSLITESFRSDVLDECDAHAYIGLEGHIKQDTQKGGSDGKEYKVTVFDKITKFPYDKKAAGKKKPSDDEEDVSKSKKKAAAPDPAAGPVKMLRKVIAVFRKKEIETADPKLVRRTALAQMIDVEPAERDLIMELIEDAAWLKERGDDLGYTVKRDGTLVIGEE